MSNKVMWSEGLFLQPQHFQQQDQYMENLIHDKTTALHANQWGFTKIELDHQALSLGKISFNILKGIFADGSVFDAPANAPLPLPLDVPEGLTNTTVYLCLPFYQNGVADMSLNNSQSGVRYHGFVCDVHDRITDNNSKASVQVAKFNLQLLLQTSDTSQYTCIPIAHIKEVRSNGTVVLDNDFLVCCLSTQACNVMSNFIKEVHSLLQHRADMIAHRLTDTQNSSNSDIADYLLLQLTNRYEPLFNHLSHQSRLHPDRLYQHCIQLLGEISTFTNDQRRASNIPLYLHHAPNESLKPLMQALRQALSTVLEQHAIAIHLTQRDFGIFMGAIEEPELVEKANFILAVYADNGGETLRANFASQVKIAPIEQIQQLVSRALPGIGMSPLAVAPRQIPYHANYTYFILDKAHPLWKALLQSGGIAVHVGGHFPGLKLELWAIKG